MTRSTQRLKHMMASLVCIGVGAVSAAVHAETGGLVHLGVRLERLDDRLNALVDPDDLLDTLHFEWFDRPYARATLAVTIKTMVALKRESALRKRGRGAIADSVLAAMMDWCEGALDRVASSPPMAGFRPSRMRVTTDQIRNLATTVPMIVFVDEASSTRHSEPFGDLDLFAALGQRYYARRHAHAGREFDAELLQRLDYLGMAAIRVGAMSTSGLRESKTSAVDSGFVRGLTLSELLQGGPQEQNNRTELLAVADPVQEETWEESLARRALARGLFGKDVYAVTDWQPPTGVGLRNGERDAISAALWMDALDGQQLTLLPGWRDLRDGSASPYASAVQKPDCVEAVAHTALDFLRLANQIEAYRSTAVVAIAVGPDAVHGEDSNRWASWTLPMWSSLALHQIPFDVIDSRRAAKGQTSKYREVIRISQEDKIDAMTLIKRLELAIEDTRKAIVRVTVRELDASLAQDVFLRQTKPSSGGTYIALINLSPDERRLNLSGIGSPTRFRDLLEPEAVVNSLDSLVMGPWRVRLLWPVLE